MQKPQDVRPPWETGNEKVFKELRCLVCTYAWFPRTPDEHPALCPCCKSHYWDKSPELPHYIHDEAEIVWLHPPELFPYVREATGMRRSRTRPVTIAETDGRVLVGYAVLHPKAEGESAPGCGTAFYRRFFYVMPHDRCFGDDCYQRSAPCEAVDPLEVRAGKKGISNDRAWSGPVKPEHKEILRSILNNQLKRKKR